MKVKVPAQWTNTITAWVWPNGGDGKEVTPTKEGDWYVVEGGNEILNVIFKNGNGWNGDSNQTVDMTFTTNTCIQLTHNSGAKAIYTVVDCEGGETPDTPDTPDTPEAGITVKAKMPAHWTNTITAWVWSDGAEGRPVTPTKDGNWYVVTENTTSLNIIFRNGTDWNGDANQTVDITGITTNTCYQLTQEGGAKATYTVVDCEDDIVEPEQPDTPETPTDVEDVQDQALAPIKVIINNALYLIMPNGDIYNAAGVLIK